jgi:hypothetical protein
MNCNHQDHFFVLQQHGAVIEHKASVAKLRGQNNAPIIHEQRIALPFKCSHTLATTSLTDRFFYGQRVFTCPEDDATHLFVELLRDTGGLFNMGGLNVFGTVPNAPNAPNPPVASTNTNMQMDTGTGADRGNSPTKRNKTGDKQE